MKRSVLFLSTLILAGQLTGCGPDTTPAAADGSNLPDEVKDFEKRRESEHSKNLPPPKAPKPDKGNAPK